MHYPDDWQVFVEQLPQSCTEDDLRVLFGSYGTVEGVRIYRFTDDLLRDVPYNRFLSNIYKCKLN